MYVCMYVCMYVYIYHLLWQGSLHELQVGMLAATLADDDDLGHPFWIAKILDIIMSIVVHWYHTFPLYVRFMTRWFFGWCYFHGYKPMQVSIKTNILFNTSIHGIIHMSLVPLL